MTDFAPHDQWLVGKEYTDYFFVATNKMREYLVDQEIPKNKVFTTGIPLSSRFLEPFNKVERPVPPPNIVTFFISSPT